MHTFSCAVQSVDVDGQVLTFAADLNDYAICTLTVGDCVVTFDRNGMAKGWEKIEPPKDPDAPVEDPAPEAETAPAAMAFPSEPEPLSPETKP